MQALLVNDGDETRRIAARRRVGPALFIGRRNHHKWGAGDEFAAMPVEMIELLAQGQFARLRIDCAQLLKAADLRHGPPRTSFAASSTAATERCQRAYLRSRSAAASLGAKARSSFHSRAKPSASGQTPAL